MSEKEKKPAKSDEIIVPLKLPLTGETIYEDTPVEVDVPDRVVIMRRNKAI
jgi:hypothetical protein